MEKPSELLRKEREMRDRDEPSPPNARRTGLWRVLVISLVLAVLALVVVVSLVGG